MHVSFQINPELSADDFIDILNRSSLGERRPVDDRERMAASGCYPKIGFTPHLQAWIIDSTAPLAHKEGEMR